MTATDSGLVASLRRRTVASSSSRAYSGTIAPAEDDEDEITIESPELPAITAGAPFSFQLEVQGGVAPYTCDVTDGALPAGLTLSDSCLLEGTATFTFSGTVAAAVPSMPVIALGMLAGLLIAVGTWVRGWGG